MRGTSAPGLWLLSVATFAALLTSSRQQQIGDKCFKNANHHLKHGLVNLLNESLVTSSVIISTVMRNDTSFGEVVTNDTSEGLFGEVEGRGLLDALKELTLMTLEFLPDGNVSQGCQWEVERVKKEAERLQLWALKIIDASAKVPSGLLNGNANQFGDFDLCLSAEGESLMVPIRGRYYLVDVDVRLKDPRLAALDDRLHSLRTMTSSITDPGQRLPKLSSWRWGLCVPSSCQPEDVGSHLRQVVSKRLSRVADVEVYVDPNLNYVDEMSPMTFGHYFTISLLCALALLLLLGTVSDPSPSSGATQRILHCFSLKRNWKDLISTNAGKDDIAVVHGARVTNAIGLFLSHKQMAQLFSPYANGVHLGTIMSGAWTMVGRSAILYTDTFILISGLLTAHSMIKELDQDKKINVKKTFISRYLRFTPNLVFLILVCTYLSEFMGSGPLWGLVVTKYSTLCKSNMWRNLLYIHNFFGFEDMCLTHTHQLGIDMQLFLLSPILVYLLWRNPRVGTSVLLVISAVSTWLRYTVAMQHQLSPVIYYGVSVDRLFKTARYSYILPSHRATVYCMGLILGYIVRRGLYKMKMSAATTRIGWSIALATAAVSMFGPWTMGIKGYEYNAFEAAAYSAFSPILWGLFVFWTAIAGWNGKGGWLYSVLSWKYFIIFTRISYAFYLVQFPVFFFNVGKLRTSLHYTKLFAIIDLKELTSILVLSVLLTLVVDMPFQNIKKLIYPSKSSANIVKNINNNETKAVKAS